MTKNKLWNLIMQEADKIQEESNDVEEMKFKLAGLYGRVLKKLNK